MIVLLDVIKNNPHFEKKAFFGSLKEQSIVSNALQRLNYCVMYLTVRIMIELDISIEHAMLQLY